MIDLRNPYQPPSAEEYYQSKGVNPVQNILQSLQQGFSVGREMGKTSRKRAAAAAFIKLHPEFEGAVTEDNFDQAGVDLIKGQLSTKRDAEKESFQTELENKKEAARYALEKLHEDSRTAEERMHWKAMMDSLDKRFANQNWNSEQNRLAGIAKTQGRLDLTSGLWGLNNWGKTNILGEDPATPDVASGFQGLGGQFPGAPLSPGGPPRPPSAPMGGPASTKRKVKVTGFTVTQ